MPKSLQAPHLLGDLRKLIEAALLLLAAAAAPAAFLLACSQALDGPPICSARLPCSGDNSCVLGRCRVNGTQPVSLNAPRHTFPPWHFALIRNGEVQHGQQLGDTLRLGTEGQSATLFFSFAVKLPDDARLQRALLTLRPQPRCVHAVNHVSLTLQRITGGWKPTTLRATAPPTMSLPMRYADEHLQGGALRVDVTEVVKDWLSGRRRDTGLALTVAGHGERASCFSTGRGDAAGPQLEVYLWPPDAGADAGRDAGDAGDTGTGGMGGMGGDDNAEEGSS